MEQPETIPIETFTKTSQKEKKKNVPLAEPEDDDVETLVGDSGIICEEEIPESKEATRDECNEAKPVNCDDDAFVADPGGNTSGFGGAPGNRKGKGVLEMGEGSEENVASVVITKGEPSKPSEPTVTQMNGDLDMNLEQIIDVNGNGTGKSKKWFEQKIAELEELEKSSVVAVTEVVADLIG